MRKASYVLGIIGGCLALIFALISLIGGLLFILGGRTILSEIFNIVNNSIEMGNFHWDYIGSSFLGWIGGFMVFFMFALTLAAGILGLVGAASVNKNNIKAGVLMLVGAGISFITPAFGFLPMVLFLLGGIFALVKEKPAQNGIVQQ